MKQKRTYTAGFKLDILKQADQKGVYQVAELTGIPVTTIYGWYKAKEAGRLTLTKETSDGYSDRMVKWNKENSVFITVKLHVTYDKDLIEHLRSRQGSTNSYIKALIREDMRKNKQNDADS